MLSPERLVLSLAGVAVVVGGVLLYGEKRYHDGRAAERQAYEEAAQLQREVVRGKNLKQEAKAQEVDRGQVRRAQVAEAAARAARDELDRLRDEISSRRDLPGSPTCTRELESARTAERLLGTCAERYTDVAGRADALANQLRGYQALTGSDTIPD